MMNFKQFALGTAVAVALGSSGLVQQAAAEDSDWQAQETARQGEVLLGLGLAQRLHGLQALPPDQLGDGLRRREALLRLVDPAALGDFRWLLYARGTAAEPFRLSAGPGS